MSAADRAVCSAPPAEVPAVVSLALLRHSDPKSPLSLTAAHSPRAVLSLRSPSCLGDKPACTCAGVESRLPTALLLVPVVLQPAKGAHLPCVGPQGWGPICGSQHSLPRAGPHPGIFPFPLSSLPVAQVPA